MDPEREVLITGVGVVSPIGIGREAFWNALCEQRSGVGPIAALAGSRMPVAFGAELKDFDPKLYVKPRKALKVMCRELQTAFSAAALAVDDAALDTSLTSPDRVGTLFGSEMMYGDVREFTGLYHACMVDDKFSFDRWGSAFPAHMNPLWMLRNLPNMAACHVAIALDARGPSNTIVSGDASGLLALGEAVRVMERGLADVMIVGATGTRVGLTGWMYRGDVNLSHRSADPPGASRPFDADRDGMVNGEGAAALVLETCQHARARGANCLAQVAGVSSTVATQATDTAQGQAIERALSDCLRAAGIAPDQVGHVNAHGLSTQVADRIEAQAIARVLPDIPVTALKSLFGNLGTGGSLVELIGCVLALQHNLVPATRNYATPDPHCPIDVVHVEPRPSQSPIAVKISCSVSGQAAAVALQRAR